MLKTLKIRNVALIKKLELNFEAGFNVLLGETGAGKSIIIDSITFVLGGKADRNLIRTGEDFLKVEASFENYSKQTAVALSNLGLEDEGIILISRYFNRDGRNECRINGMPVSISMLRQISATLVDTYGQHENQVLLRAKNHLALVESYNPDLFEKEKTELKTILDKLKEIKNQLDEIGGSFENRERMMDILSYQISEIEQINPKIDEDSDIQNKIFAMSSSEKIKNAISSITKDLDGNNGVMTLFKNIQHEFRSIENFDEKFKALNERIISCEYEAADILEETRSSLSNFDYDELELEALDSRLDSIKKLKSKYGPNIQDVLNFLEEAKTKLENLLNADQKLKTLKKEELNFKNLAFQISTKLSEKRRALAIEIEDKITKELADLGMKNSRFKIDFNYPKQFDEDISYSNAGFDNVEFLFSANLGEELKPLSKTISGGEMSRFMLALKNILADNDGVATLIFDEVDSGISGIIGMAIAKKLANLSKKFQVLCITHLSQVSAMADNYYYVNKKSFEGTTQTFVEKLAGNRIIEQIAEISGGDIKTDKAFAYAKELKDNAEAYKKQIS